MVKLKVKPRTASIWYRLCENISYDYLELFIVTSRAAGLEPTEGRSFGVGKSTFALWMAYRAFAYQNGTLYFANVNGDVKLVDETSEKEKIELMKHIIDNYLFFSLDEVIEAIRKHEKPKPIPAIVWDDVQDSCPAYTHIPPKTRRKIEYLTRARQRVANIILTAPSMGEIAKPLRNHINWEIIIPTRGIYEVQFIYKRRDFYNPTEDKGRLWYEATGTFKPLPPQIDIYYKKARDQKLSEAIFEEEKTEPTPQPQNQPQNYYEKIKAKVIQLAKQGTPIQRIAVITHIPKKEILKIIEAELQNNIYLH